MLQTSNTPARQVLLRLPEDVAARLSRAVPSRRRNQFLVDLLRRELEKEDDELVAACEAMNRMEAASPELAVETRQWLDALLMGPSDDADTGFDADKFSSDAATAQAALPDPPLKAPPRSRRKP